MGGPKPYAGRENVGSTRLPRRRLADHSVFQARPSPSQATARFFFRKRPIVLKAAVIELREPRERTHNILLVFRVKIDQKSDPNLP